MKQKRTCEGCVYLKTLMNQKEMIKQGKDEKDIIWFHGCEHLLMPAVVEDLTVAETCEHYDDDVWAE